MSDQLEAGPELDRRVAEAVGDLRKDHNWVEPLYGPLNYYECSCGMRAHTRPLSEGERLLPVTDPSDPTPCLNPYSTDLNAAFRAAEKVNDYVVVMKHELSTGGLWECKLSPRNSLCEWVRAETPALAICGAILKLKENSD